MRFSHLLVLLLSTIIFSCTMLTLEPANYAWPVESVLEVNNSGEITEARYSFILNVSKLFLKEYENNNIDEGTKLRVIRDQKGFYFITSRGFKNVYVFETGEGKMNLVNIIEVFENRKFENPAFNQRAPHIEFLDGEQKVLLNINGVVR